MAFTAMVVPSIMGGARAPFAGRGFQGMLRARAMTATARTPPDVGKLPQRREQHGAGDDSGEA